MISQQSLTKKVAQELRLHHNIRLNLPNLYRSIDSKVTLKYLKSFPILKSQNRYHILIQKTQQLLKRNLLSLQKVKSFSEDFFNTITEDILILQQNQKLRKRCPIIKDQILFKRQDITTLQYNIQTECMRINDKEDVIAFISGQLNNYINKLKAVEEEYAFVNRFQILTSINIDQVYNQQLAHDEEDYRRHFHPLLELLHKLKSNMIRLYQEIQNCDPYDVPLRCVNFLANCRNLITQMQPFLLNDDCAFNRLIFHVVRCQKQNLQLISLNYQTALNFSRSIIADLFKIYYLAYMFKPSYIQVKQSLQSSRQVLLKLIDDDSINDIKLLQVIRGQSLKLEENKEKIIEIKRTVGVGQGGLMKDYVRRKQCKKAQLIDQCRQDAKNLRKIIQKISQYSKIKKQIQKLQNKQFQESSLIIKQIRWIQKQKERKVPYYGLQQKTQKQESVQCHFQETFIRVQQLILQVNRLKQLLQVQSSLSIHLMLSSYIMNCLTSLTNITHTYLQLQTKLLNSYQPIKEQKLKLSQETLQIRQRTIQEVEKWLRDEVVPNVGGLVMLEDTLTQQVEKQIMLIDKAIFMLNNYNNNQLKQHNSNQNHYKHQPSQSTYDQLTFYKYNLQWLYAVFNGSFDESIFERIMDKLDFQLQQYQQGLKKVEELIQQVKKYQKQLKKILKQNRIQKIHQKILKIIKERIQLYQTIQDIYSECLLVFKQVKSKESFNIQNKGLLLFSQPTYKYVLLLYQFKTKLRTELQQLSQLLLPVRTKNYLIDQLYQPFSIRFSKYINFGQEELLNFLLRLEHSLNVKQGETKIIKGFQDVLTKQYHQDYFQNVIQVSAEMVDIFKNNIKVIALENQPVVVHNLMEFKQIIQANIQYYKLAEQIHKQLSKVLEQNDSNLRLTMKYTLQSQRAKSLRETVLSRWQQHISQVNDI